MNEIDEKTKSILMEKWNKIKYQDTWIWFGGTMWLDNVKFNVIPRGNEEPKFIKHNPK
jgi:hypothetical protein